MDFPPNFKRLVIIIAVSVIIIFISKSLLSKAVKNLNIEVQKQQAQTGKKPTLPESAPAQETAPVIEVTSAPLPSSGIESTAELAPAPIRNSSGNN